jgi:hypothetical protein
MDILTQKSIDDLNERVNSEIERIVGNNEEDFGWLSLNILRAEHEAIDKIQLLLTNKGLMPSSEYIEDENKEIHHFVSGFKWGKNYIKVNNKYYNFPEEVSITDFLKTKNWKQIELKVPHWYRLSGDKMGHAWVEFYISPINHVTGEKNEYWD